MNNQQRKAIFIAATDGMGFNDILAELNTKVVDENSKNYYLSNLGYLIKQFKMNEVDLLDCFKQIVEKPSNKKLNLDGYTDFIYNFSKIFNRSLIEIEIPVIFYEQKITQKSE